MKPLFIYLMTVSLAFSEDLRTLLEYAQQHNHLIQSAKISTLAKEKELESVKKSYYPTLDGSLFYQRDDDATPFQPGTVYGASAEVSWSVYEGGKRKYTEKSSQKELSAQRYTQQTISKDIALKIVQDFYKLQTLYAELHAQQDAQRSIQAQLNRSQEFFNAKLATEDMVQRLQAAYDKSTYIIESLKFQILTLKKQLELTVGRAINSLDDSHFKKLHNIQRQPLDKIAKLQATQQALIYKSEVVSSYYYPTIELKDRYSLYGYQNTPTIKLPNIPEIPVDYLENQNHIEATLTLRLFDFGKLKEQKEAIVLQAKAMQQQILYEQKEQDMQLLLATQRIETAYLRLKSAKSALKAASSAFELINAKYVNGLADNVTYLDALKAKTEAKSAYKKALYEIEIAYAIYYYYTANNLEEFIQ